MTPVQKKYLFENSLNPAHVFVQNYVSTGLKVNITPCLALDAEVNFGLRTKIRASGAGPLGQFTRGITMKNSNILSLIGIVWNY